MIEEVKGVIDAYEGLDRLGKRLFREELGLLSAKGVKKPKVEAGPKKPRAPRKPRTKTPDITKGAGQTAPAEPAGVPTAGPIPTVAAPIPAAE